MTKAMKKNRLFNLLGTCILTVLLAACNTIVAFNTNGKIDFHAGVYDPHYQPLTVVQDHMFFMGGWGKNEPESEMAKYAFTLNSNYFTLRNVTLDDGYTSYDNIWNYIPMKPKTPGGKTSVLHTQCIITYNPQRVGHSMPATNGKYKCRIICDSRPLGNGKMFHTIEITVYTKPSSNSDLDQLNIKVEGDEGISVDYL